MCRDPTSCRVVGMCKLSVRLQGGPKRAARAAAWAPSRQLDQPLAGDQADAHRLARSAGRRRRTGHGGRGGAQCAGPPLRSQGRFASQATAFGRPGPRSLCDPSGSGGGQAGGLPSNLARRPALGTTSRLP